MDYSQRHLLNRNKRSYHRWCVVRHLSNCQNVILTHFSSRTEAEARMQFLTQANPTASYEVVFDESMPASDTTQSWQDD